MAVYRLFWDEFSSWYLEMIKPAYGQPIDSTTLNATIGYFETLLKMLHPFMPFITEELWQHIYERKAGESIMRDKLTVSPATEADAKLLADVENVKLIVGGIRTVRNQKNIPSKDALTLQAVGSNPYAAYNCIITKMANISAVDTVEEALEVAKPYLPEKPTIILMPEGSLTVPRVEN